MAAAVKISDLGEQKSQQSSAHAKVMQTELSLAFLLRMKTSSGQTSFKLVHGGTPTCLTPLDRCTAENLRATLLAQLDSLPELRRTAEQFPVKVRHTCADRFSGNIAAEKALDQDFADWWPLHMWCDVHKMYSCTERAMNCFTGDVSGVLSLGLAMTDVGSVSTMRSALCRILHEDLRIHFAPAPEGWAVQYRQQLFDAFLPVQHVEPARRKTNLLRRYIISNLLNGRLDTPKVAHYCVHACCRDERETYHSMTTHLAWALIPGACPRFLKSRWVGYDKALDWAGLLAGVHNLLPRLVQALTGTPEQCLQASHGLAQRDGGWDDVFAAEIDHPRPEEPSQAAEGQPDPASEPDLNPNAADGDAEGFDWKQFMRAKKKQAFFWAQSNPFPRLVIMKEVVFILLKVMQRFLALSGQAWEKEQQSVAAAGERRTYVVCEAAADADVRQALSELTATLQQPVPAMLPQDVTPQLRLLRFSAFSNASTSLHALLRLPRSGFPYALFKLPLQSPASFLRSRPCLRDEFTSRLLNRYAGNAAARFQVGGVIRLRVWV